MAENLRAAMQAWQEADEQARAAENLLHDVWREWDGRRGPAVTQQLIDEVARLRDKANDKLMVVLSLLRR
jgi:hypothetical protein